MDVENVSELIDYVYTTEDFNLKPSMQEYQKLKRIMKVMVRFYQKGTDSKKGQLEIATDERTKLIVDKKMIEEQMAAIDQFPPFHPKRQEYEGQLERELEALIEQDKVYEEQEKNFTKLLEWSKGVVRAVEWLELRLEQYCNSLFDDLNLEQNPIKLTVDEYKFYSKCLDEITYNLQESQDFFNASVDGRLKMFHQLEKCMIEAQLEVIRKYPVDNLRRKHVETELLKDLEYVADNMKENPQVMKHREKMRLMHVDFFKLLKWQREMMSRLPFDSPELFVGGDMDQLKRELTEKEQEGKKEEIQYANGQGQTEGLHVKYREFTASQQTEGTDGTCPVKSSVNGVDSVNEAMNGLNMNECPVMPKKSTTTTTSSGSASEDKQFIHKVYDENVKI